MFKSYEIVIGADVLAITVVVVAADVVVVVAFVFEPGGVIYHHLATFYSL